MPKRVTDQNTKAVLLNLPVSLVDQLDQAANVLQLTRTDVIRRSLLRDLQFITNHELGRAIASRIDQDSDYSLWVAQSRKIDR